MAFGGLTDFYMEIAKGNVSGHSQVNKFGQNSDIDSGTEDIWDGGSDANANGTYDFISSAAALKISSTSGLDSQDITVVGLDADWNEQTVTQTLAGQTETEVGSGKTWIRIFRAFNAGSSALAGTVYVYQDDTVVAGVPQTAAKIHGIITAGEDQTLMAIWSAAADTKAYLTSFYTALTGTVAAQSVTRVKIREFGKAWRTKQLIAVKSTGATYLRHELQIPILIPAKADVRLEATTNAANTGVAGGFDIVVVDDNYATDQRL